MAPPSPSERKRLSIKDRSPDLRLGGPSRSHAPVVEQIAALADGCSSRFPDSTRAGSGALTVAGQWRIYTAFPCILMIAVVASLARRSGGEAVMK